MSGRSFGAERAVLTAATPRTPIWSISPRTGAVAGKREHLMRLAQSPNMPGWELLHAKHGLLSTPE